MPKAPVVLKPNPKNIELDEKLAQLEINIKRYVERKLQAKAPCSNHDQITRRKESLASNKKTTA